MSKLDRGVVIENTYGSVVSGNMIGGAIFVGGAYWLSSPVKVQNLVTARMAEDVATPSTRVMKPLSKGAMALEPLALEGSSRKG